jgi:hypothetical protein
MKKLLLGAVVSVLLVGCGTGEPEVLVEEHPAVGEVSSAIDPRQPVPQFCFGTCSQTPTIERLGHLCTLSSSTCVNGMLTCYYKCIEIEPSPYP